MTTPSLAFLRKSATLLLILCGLVGMSRAQANESDIKARLIGKPLYLRGFWTADKLNFDNTGNLTSKSPIGPFTLCGVEVSEVRMRPDVLTIEARRMGLEFQNDTALRVPLNTSISKVQQDEQMQIQIAAPATGDYTAALDAIFADGLPDIVPQLPAYWQRYMRAFLSGTRPPVHVRTGPNGEMPKAVRGSVLPPKVIFHIEPAFNVEARRLKYAANVLLFLTVESDGSVNDMSLLQAAGIGLDEQALAAVSQYKFQPATENGTPVAVTLSMGVKFDIF